MDDTAGLNGRVGLPAEMLYLRDAYPRLRWSEPLPDVAAHWLQMHDGFREHQAHMLAMVEGWRGGATDVAGLHRALIPALQGFLQHLDGHHRIESGHYFPQFRRIEPRISAGIDLLDRDHETVHVHLETLHRLGFDFHRAVTENDQPKDAGERLADALEAAGAPLLRHLEDEEDIVIPLMALRVRGG